MTFRVFNSEEQGGLRPKGAPPIVSKREKQKNTRVPIYRLTGHWSAFERTTCVRTHQLFVVERKACVRSQITAVAARADWACVRPQVPCVRTQITARAGWACVRPLLMRATVSAFERTWQESASSLGAFCLLLAMF
jgi:hypothetical protein